jgi:hypothetical protein
MKQDNGKSKNYPQEFYGIVSCLLRFHFVPFLAVPSETDIRKNRSGFLGYPGFTVTVPLANLQTLVQE